MYCSLGNAQYSKTDTLTWELVRPTDIQYPISEQEKDSIANFTLEKYIIFVKAMYRNYFNVDSLFPGEGIKEFERNPFIAEFPELVDYEYSPIIEVVPQHGGRSERFRPMINLYQVNKIDRFIKSKRTDQRTSKDTLFNHYFPRYSYSNIISPGLNSRFSVFYCPPRKSLRIVGGDAFLEEIPFVEEYLRLEQGLGYLLARTINYSHSKIAKKEHDYGFSYERAFNRLDTIGSIILNKEREYQYWSMGEISHSGRYDNERWLVIIQKPLAWLRFSEEELAQVGENWIDIPVELIRFEKEFYIDRTTATGKIIYRYFEYRRTIRAKPNSVNDNRVKKREITKEEFEKYRKDNNIRYFTFDGNKNSMD